MPPPKEETAEGLIGDPRGRLTRFVSLIVGYGQ